jgi:hypothetical protein
MSSVVLGCRGLYKLLLCVPIARISPSQSFVPSFDEVMTEEDEQLGRNAISFVILCPVHCKSYPAIYSNTENLIR